MASNGRQLEDLVAFAERLNLPPGLTIRTNNRVTNDEGVPIAEFDIEIRGKVGTTDFSWLIECRDRPSHGAAPSSWIEQLVGRRARFGFNKVTAVSTTGFADGAVQFAKAQGIEIREVVSLTPESFDWLQLTTMKQRLRIHALRHADIVIAEGVPHRRQVAAMKAIGNANGGDSVLVSSTTGARVTLEQVFIAAVRSIPDAFDDVAEGSPKPMEIHATFPADDHYLVATSDGGVRVGSIYFTGELQIQESDYPVVTTSEYRGSQPGEVISQVVTFAPTSLQGQKLAFELHRVTTTGKIHVVARKIKDKA